MSLRKSKPNTFLSLTGDITQLKELNNMTRQLPGFFPNLCLEKKTRFLIDWAVERRGFQPFVFSLQSESLDIFVMFLSIRKESFLSITVSLF